MSARPPALLRGLLERALPAEVRDGIVGDLDEIHHTRSQSGGARAALWYAAQVVMISIRFLPERIEDALGSIGPDLKLGARMLFKYPMLTVVGGIAITVATAIGLGASEFLHDLLVPELPLEEGDRVVRLYQVDGDVGDRTPASLYDVGIWRESVPSLEDLGAYVSLEQGLVSDRGESGTVSLARTSASMFALTRIPPRLGRFLVEDDERPDAEPVVVLGHDAWQSLLAGDPDAIGRTVMLGGAQTTVVGVMPEGFAFPVNQDAWTPLGVDPAELTPEAAPRANVFARLAPGATLESARAELDVAGQRAAAAFPDVYARLTPELTEFARRATDFQTLLARSGAGLAFIVLLIVACANVMTLGFVRTIMREGEIAVRAALGASRRRILLQLFAEALVLVGAATLLGLVAVRLALPPISRLFFIVQQEPRLPFWWNDGLSPGTFGYAALLTVVGAFMIGVVPGLKATGNRVLPGLGELSSGGTRLRLGGMWTVLIVLQVALVVAFLPFAVTVEGRAGALEVRSGPAFEIGEFPADDYMTAQLGRDLALPPRTAEERDELIAASTRLFQEVRDRVAEDPAVAGAALASGLSAMNHLGVPVEFSDGSGSPVSAGARVLLVDRSYLDLMDATIVSGQALGPADFAPEARSVLVNEAFVDYFLAGRSPVGGELRFPERRGESSVVSVPPVETTVQIVGVVRNPGIDVYGPGAHAVIYAPLDWAPVNPRSVGVVGMPQAPAAQLYVRRRPGADPLVARLYGIVASVDPTLRLSEVGTAATAWAPVHQGARVITWIIRALAAIVLMLSVAGVYALMSFTVRRRTREIAIRAAVGAGGTDIVRSVFRRASLQLLAGVALGSLLGVPTLVDRAVDDGPRSLVIVAVLLLAAGLAACMVPVRRALSIEPASAMKSE